MTAIPRALQRDLDLIRAEYGPMDIYTDELGVVVFTLVLRGVDVRAAVELSQFPGQPPTVHTDGSWEHPVLHANGEVKGLVCFAPWNRTYGVAHVIRELNARFVEEPPVRRPRRALVSGQGS